MSMGNKFAGIGHDLRADQVPVTIDGLTGQVIEPDYSHVHCTDGLGNKSTIGFGPTRKMLDVAPFPSAPWLTVELAEQELSRPRRQHETDLMSTKGQ